MLAVNCGSNTLTRTECKIKVTAQMNPYIIRIPNVYGKSPIGEFNWDVASVFVCG